jgi:hypothetical protein
MATPASSTSETVALVVGGIIGAVLGTFLGVGIQMAFEWEGRFYLAFLLLGAVAGGLSGRGLVIWNRDRALPDVKQFQEAGDVDALIEAFRNSGPGRRFKAMKALGALKDPRSVEPLIEILNSHPDEDARQRAAQALGDIGDQRAVEPLKRAEGSSDQSLRIMAGGALRKLGAL